MLCIYDACVCDGGVKHADFISEGGGGVRGWGDGQVGLGSGTLVGCFPDSSEKCNTKFSMRSWMCFIIQ